MKRLLTIILLFTTFISNAQLEQYLGGKNTTIRVRGILKPDSGLIPPFDTLSTSPVGAMAIKNNIVYFKTSSGWFSSNSGSSISLANLRGSNLSTPIPSYYCSDKGKEGFFYYDATDNTSVDNTGTIIVDAGGHRYKRIISNFIDVQWFGAIGDGTTNSTAAINAAIDFATTGNTLSKIVRIPQGTFLVDSIKIRNCSIIGDNGRTTIQARVSSASGLFVLVDTPAQKITIANLKLVGNASNTNQHCFNITAIPQTSPSYTGGLWDSKFQNLDISGFKGHGFHFYCSDGLGDMANQFLTLDHVKVSSTSDSSSKGLYVEGQMGQLTVEDSEFDGQGSTNAGTVGVDLRSLLTSNDQIFGAITFKRVTIQAVKKAVYTYFAQGINFQDCWLENDSLGFHATNKSRVTVQNTHIANVGTGLGSYIFGNDGSILDAINNGLYGTLNGRFYTSPAGSPGGGRIFGNYGQDNLSYTTVFVGQNINVASNTLNTGYFRDIVTNGTYSKSSFINTINSNLNPLEQILITCSEGNNPYSFVQFRGQSGNIQLPSGLDSNSLVLRNGQSALFQRSDLLNTWRLISVSKNPIYSDTIPNSTNFFTGEIIYNNNPTPGTAAYWVYKGSGWDSITVGSAVNHPLGFGSSPTSSGLGTNVTSLTISGTDANMKLTLVTSGAVSGTIGTINFASAWPNTPIVIISSANSTTGSAIANTSGGYVAINGTSTTAAVMTGAISAAGTYIFNVRTGGN